MVSVPYGRIHIYVLVITDVLLSILSQLFNMAIYHGVGTPGHGGEVVDSLDYTNKRFIFHMMANVQLPGSEWFGTKITVHTETQTIEMSLAMEFQKHFSNTSRKHGILYHGKHKKVK